MREVVEHGAGGRVGGHSVAERVGGGQRVYRYLYIHLLVFVIMGGYGLQDRVYLEVTKVHVQIVRREWGVWCHRLGGES